MRYPPRVVGCQSEDVVPPEAKPQVASDRVGYARAARRSGISTPLAHPAVLLPERANHHARRCRGRSPFTLGGRAGVLVQRGCVLPLGGGQVCRGGGLVPFGRERRNGQALGHRDHTDPIGPSAEFCTRAVGQPNLAVRRRVAHSDCLTGVG
jgi:hypothetical protein